MGIAAPSFTSAGISVAGDCPVMGLHLRPRPRLISGLNRHRGLQGLGVVEPSTKGFRFKRRLLCSGVLVLPLVFCTWSSSPVVWSDMLIIPDIVCHNCLPSRQELCSLRSSQRYPRDQDNLGRVRDTTVHGNVDLSNKVTRLVPG